MMILKEKYPGAYDDLRAVFRWLKRKTKDRLSGREYIFSREDFLDLARGVRFGNWMATRLWQKKWYQKFLDGMFGPVENPKIQSRKE